MADRRNTVIAVVTPWWGEETSGGAEFLARQIAEQLALRGFATEVLTTCGRDAFSSWSEDHFPAGAVQQNGLTVRRFPLDRRDEARFARLYELAQAPRLLTANEERDFLANSINSHALYAFIEAHRQRYAFLFIPYLYGTTYFGSQAARDRALIVPCLHNEPLAYLEPFHAMMAGARGLWFLTEPEFHFARTLYPIQNVETRVVGAGLDFCGRGDGEAFRRRHGIEGPFVLFAGRRVPGKGFGLLLDCFEPFGRRHPEWTLVLAGPGGAPKSARREAAIRDLGLVEKQELWDAMAGATVFCQPSHVESFSYVLMEAWAQGTPALVNAGCEVLRWQCEMSGGGLWFDGPETFGEALVYLREHPEVAAQIGRQGQEHVRRNLRWPLVMDRAEALLAACGLVKTEKTGTADLFRSVLERPSDDLAGK